MALQLHVEGGRVQDYPAVGVAGIVLQCEPSVWGAFLSCGGFVLWVSDGQRVAVDVVDAGVVSGRVLSP